MTSSLPQLQVPENSGPGVDNLNETIYNGATRALPNVDTRAMIFYMPAIVSVALAMCMMYCIIYYVKWSTRETQQQQQLNATSASTSHHLMQFQFSPFSSSSQLSSSGIIEEGQGEGQREEQEAGDSAEHHVPTPEQLEHNFRMYEYHRNQQQLMHLHSLPPPSTTMGHPNGRRSRTPGGTGEGWNLHVIPEHRSILM